MAWIRLDDDYIYHPKFVLLSDRAFRLWHEGACYCRKLMTDGLIARGDLKAFKYASPKTIQELITPRGQSSPLWVEDPAGYRVHDYLDWNPSQAEEQREREATKLRVRAFRGRQRLPSSNGSGNGVRNTLSNASVPGEGQGKDLRSSERERERKPTSSLESEDVSERAGRLVEHYGELYTEHRHGARHRARPNLDWSEACELVKLWSDQRLEKLAILVLSTDDPWISGTDRSFKIFALKASWADERLTAWEHENGVAV